MIPLENIWTRSEAYEAEPRSHLYNPPLPVALLQAVFSGRNCCLLAVCALLYFVGRSL